MSWFVFVDILHYSPPPHQLQPVNFLSSVDVRKLLEGYQRVTRELLGGYQGVTRVGYQGVTRELPGSYQGLPESYQGVIRGLTGSYQGWLPGSY